MPIALPATVSSSVAGYSSFGQGTPKTVVVGSTSTILLNANSNRVYAEIINNGSAPIWIQLGIAAQLGVGVKIMPNGMRNFKESELYLGQINAVTATGTVNTEVIEGVN